MLSSNWRNKVSIYLLVVFIIGLLLAFGGMSWKAHKDSIETRKQQKEREYELSRPPYITKITTKDGKEHYAVIHEKMSIHHDGSLDGRYWSTYIDFSSYWKNRTKEQAEQVLAGYLKQLEEEKAKKDSKTIVKTEELV
jgi:hypothetical protein